MIEATIHKPTYDELEAEVLRLRHELDMLRRLIFGQKRERFVPETSPDQLQIDLGEVLSKIISVKTEQVTYIRRQKSVPQSQPHSRLPLPEHLPRKTIVIEPEEDMTGWKKIGEEITEELEYEPGKLFVNCYIRPKYVNPAIDTDDAAAVNGPSSLPAVVIGELPSRPIDKGIPGPGLLAHILISKFCDHLPWYRQRTQFKRLGVDLAISTMCDWHKSTCELAFPLYQTLFKLVTFPGYVMADETPLRVLDRTKSGKTHLGYMWLYYNPVKRLVFFDYQPDRSRHGPSEILKDFKGYLQTDGYGGYNEVNRRPEIIALSCMSHARRKFVDCQKTDPQRVAEILLKFQPLYDVERQAREGGLSYEARFQLRDQYARPILADMKAWLTTNAQQVVPKSALGKAIAYTLNLWPRLERYLEDGRLEIDNNLIENQVRPVALGRKNYLFAGSHDGARLAAIIYSLVATAKQHHVEPFTYLKDVLARIADHPFHKLDELLPPKWTPLAK
jgi:transposase